MPRRLFKMFRLRNLVRDYSLEYLEENPDATVEEAEQDVGDMIRSDFARSPFLSVLLALLPVLLPLLIDLLDGDDVDPVPVPPAPEPGPVIRD